MKIIEKTYRQKCLILPCLRYDDSGFSEFFDLLLFILFFSSKFRPARFVEAEVYAWQSYAIYKQNFLEEIIKRTKLCIKLVKERMDENEKKMLALTKKENEKRMLWKTLRKKSKRQQNFWKTIMPFLSDKIVLKEQIALIKNDKIISEDSYVAHSLHFLLLNIATNLKLPEYTDNNSICEKITDLIKKSFWNVGIIQAYSL